MRTIYVSSSGLAAEPSIDREGDDAAEDRPQEEHEQNPIPDDFEDAGQHQVLQADPSLPSSNVSKVNPTPRRRSPHAGRLHPTVYEEEGAWQPHGAPC